MSRFRPSEYRTEKRQREKPFEQQTERCEGGLGLCTMKHVAQCPFCQKPHCINHYGEHHKRCRGMR